MVRSQFNKRLERRVVGFLRRDRRWVVDIEECAIAEPELNEQIREVRADPPPRGGTKVVVRLQPEGWEVPPDSFFQNNLCMLPRLVEVVHGRLGDGGGEHLIDAYCGVGFFGIELAKSVKSFVGVECDERAVRAAKRNAARRGAGNGEFVLGNSEEVLPRVLERFDPRRTAVLLDPPRVGCRPATIEALRLERPAQILYVSCHPATLARDLKALCSEDGYEVESVTPLDMFPQTQHVECVADLRLSR
jgi:23S rRNA (uracil1939-C5)-methyltransferase